MIDDGGRSGPGSPARRGPAIAIHHPGVAVVSLGYVAAFTAYGFSVGRLATPVYLVSMLAAMAVVTFGYRRVHFSRGVLWCLSAWGFAHMSGGLIEVNGDVLYHLQLIPAVLRYDQAVHAFGFGSATVAVWEALQLWVGPDRRVTFGLAVVVALAGMGVGAINEVLEFLITRVSSESNVGGFVNTGWDLVFNSFGCVAAALIVWHRSRGRQATTSPVPS